MTLPVRHQCRPPFLARTGACDCSRCCASAPHQPGCMELELAEMSKQGGECVCPEDAEYHLDDCPED